MTKHSANHSSINLADYGYELNSLSRVWMRPRQQPIAYSDGDDIEQRIGSAIKDSADVSLFSMELRKHQLDWPSTYHLSPVRANLLRPISGLFKEARVLEVGAGCGAITRYLGEQQAQVLALEGSSRRASITADRCRDLSNVTVVADRFDAFNPEAKFDVVTLVGVLEYARLYSEGADPVQEVLGRARALLSDDGVLLVAIENQLGLKYFAGAREDHIGRAMAGIQDHYDTAGVVTFGKAELEARLKSAGFGSTQFALPFPDYKLPQTVILPLGYAGNSGFAADSLAGQSMRADRQLDHAPLFSMGPAFGVLQRNDLLADLSNSFLLLAGKSETSPSFASLAPGKLAVHYAVERPPGYTKATHFVARNGAIIVERERLLPDAAVPPSVLMSQILQDEPYLSGVNWGDRLEAIVSRPGWGIDDIEAWILTWRSAIASALNQSPDKLSLDSVVSGAMFDAVPRNLVVAENDARFFDLEWVANAPLTFGFLAYRAIRVSFEHVLGVAAPNDDVLLHFPTLVQTALRRMGILVTSERLRSYFDMESVLQDEILGIVRKVPDQAAIDGFILSVSPDVTGLVRDRDEALAHVVQSMVEKEAALDSLRSELAAVTLDAVGKRQHIETLEAKIGDVEFDIAGKRQHIETLEAKIGEAESKVGQMELEVQSARESVDHARVAHMEHTIATTLKLSETSAALALATEEASRLRELHRALKLDHSKLIELHLAESESARVRTLELEEKIHDMQGEIHRLWLLLEQRDGVAEENRFLLRELARVRQFEEVAARQQQRADLMESSRSWRLTAPLRRVNAVFGRVRHGWRCLLSESFTSAYRKLPLSTSRKIALKSAIFRACAPLLRRTGAYQRWDAHHRKQAAVPLLTSSYSPPASEIPASSACEVVPSSLWQADGVREWDDYQPVLERIASKQAETRKYWKPEAASVFDFSSRTPAEVAASIGLPPSATAPSVTILVPAYNHLVTTLECLASIAATADTSGPSFEVLVADDASTDETAEVLSKIPNLRLISQPRNLGFLHNCNETARNARGRYLLLLNNDVQVTGDWLRSMVDCLESDQTIGAVGPRIIYPNGWLQEAGAVLRHDGTAEMVGLNQLPDLPRFSYTRDVDYCSGACLLLRTADFEFLGGFDDRYAPAYCEDADLCMRLRSQGRRIVYCADALVIHHLSKTSNELDSEYKLACIAQNLQTFASTWQDDLDRMDEVKTIAFYLPQFHPIPENDLWWGRGFTEWTNVAKAQPNFDGHYQPRIPADLGYYDLRLADAMEDQAQLAKRYGLHGFCYYYYWFAGKRLLERPIEQMLANASPTMPFCLCWANENWTRRWDGQEHEVLMAQHHSSEDDLAVIRDLMRYFASPYYIRVNGRPLIAVYRVTLFPDFAKTAQLWREACRAAGIGEIYIAQVESFELAMSGAKPADYGCDAAIEFPPHGMAEPYPLSARLLNADFKGTVADYRDLAVRYATRSLPEYTRFPGVMPGWDNTARRQDDSFIFENASPGAFQAWLESAISISRQQYCGDERLVFINAWNEWAEGAYLEPDRRFGHAYLEALRNAIDAPRLIRHGSYSLGD